MSDKEAKSLSGLISDPDSGLGRLAREAADRVALTDRLREALDPELGHSLRAANLREDGTLVLLASGPEWAARLRYEADRLLRLCREKNPQAARVRVRVSQEFS